MAELNTVCISTQEYKDLISDSLNLEEAQKERMLMVEYLDRVEKVIFELIKKETNYGAYEWKLSDKFKDIISVLNAHEVDWSEGKPEETDGGYQE